MLINSTLDHMNMHLQWTPFIITPLMTTPFVTLTNCDLNMYSHIPYKLLQDCDYRGKKVAKQPFMLESRCQLFKFPTWLILSSTAYDQARKRLSFLSVLIWQYTLSLSSLIFSLCILLTRFFKLRFFAFLTSSHIFSCLH